MHAKPCPFPRPAVLKVWFQDPRGAGVHRILPLQLHICVNLNFLHILQLKQSVTTNSVEADLRIQPDIKESCAFAGLAQ